MPRLVRALSLERLKIIAVVLVVLVCYQLFSHRPVVIDTVVNSNEQTEPVNDPLAFEQIQPSVPEGAKEDTKNAKIDIDGSKDTKVDADSPKDSKIGLDESKNKDLDSDSKAAGTDAKPDVKTPSKGSKGSQDPKVISALRDYTIFFDGMEKYAINAPSLKDNYKTSKAAEKFSSNSDFLFSKDYLENVLDISSETLELLKKSHHGYVNEHMEKLINQYKISTFGNLLESDEQWGDFKDSKGYVMIGGGRFSWLSYLVIKQIRAIGSTLPIELFIPSSNEYEKKFCDDLLPRYNARCNVFNGKLTEDLNLRFGLGGYQYKMLAILSSQFENIIYLDSDNFPVRNPEPVLESKLYKDTGLILWPDAWARTTNPLFYDIAEVPVKENKIRMGEYDKAHDEKPLDQYTFKDSWFHTFEGTLPDPTSETGMMIINKTKQLKTLLLSLYYNVYGPDFYYPLMTQGSAGEGDKETFIAAAHVLNQPWFQTLKQFRWVGYVSENDGKFTSKALGHYDPVQSQTDPDGDLDFMFMHLSYPKYYPNWLVDNHDLVYELGNHIRMYQDIYSNAGYDFDLRVLQFFTQGMCANYYDENGISLHGDGLKKLDEYMGNYLFYVSLEPEVEEQRCSEVFIPHLKWLKETTEYPHLVVQPETER